MILEAYKILDYAAEDISVPILESARLAYAEWSQEEIPTTLSAEQLQDICGNVIETFPHMKS